MNNLQRLEKEVAQFALQYYHDEPTPFRNVNITDILLTARLWELAGRDAMFSGEQMPFTAFFNAWAEYKVREITHAGKNPVG